MDKREDITKQIIDDSKKAYKYLQNIIRRGKEVLYAHRLWGEIYGTDKYQPVDFDFKADSFSEELYEAMRLFFFLWNSDQDLSKKDLYKQATKDIILQISNKFRHDDTGDYIIDPALMINLQDIIHVFDSSKLPVDAADMSAVKAQITGTLLQWRLVRKYQFGSDMLQYAECYYKLGYKDEAIKIYEALIRDFDLDETSFERVFPEVNMIKSPGAGLDDKQKEKYVSQKAAYELAQVNGLEAVEPTYIILNEDIHFHKMIYDEAFRNKMGDAAFDQAAFEKSMQLASMLTERAPDSFMDKVRRFFKFWK